MYVHSALLIIRILNAHYKLHRNKTKSYNIYRKNLHGKAVKAIICCNIFIFYLVFTL